MIKSLYNFLLSAIVSAGSVWAEPPESVSNLSAVVYSSTAADIFWERTDTPGVALDTFNRTANGYGQNILDAA